jgi:hypothetical protein
MDRGKPKKYQFVPRSKTSVSDTEPDHTMLYTVIDKVEYGALV